jgi:hypothetical protein
MSRIVPFALLVLVLVFSVSLADAAPLAPRGGRAQPVLCGVDRLCTPTPSGSPTMTSTPTATSAVATASPSPTPFQTSTPLPLSFTYRLYVTSVQR